MWRSEPQMVVQSTRTMASVSSRICRFGTSSQALDPGPWNTSAFMMTPFFSRCCVGDWWRGRLAVQRLMLDDDASADFEGRDADEVEAGAAGPGVEGESGDWEPLCRLFDQAGMTADQNAPTLAHGLVYVVDLERHDTDDTAGHGV